MTSGRANIRLRLDVEYDGSSHAGYQRQAGVRTVQSDLESAARVYLIQLAKRRGIPFPEIPSIVASGRTDSGVHARRQVASLLWPVELSTEIDSPEKLERLRRALDGITGREIAVLEVRPAAADFDPRRRVVRKQYRYQILNREASPGLSRGRSWWLRGKLDLAAMIGAARALRGTHDFRSFCSLDCTAKNFQREILLSEVVRISSEEIVYLVQGRGFLKQMVRIIVGTLVEIGLGNRPADDVGKILAACDRSQAGRTAPPWGLFLDWVRYEGE